MTREEKEKAIDALKTSAPIMAVTQEEFKDYIQTLNKIMDWLEQEPFINKPCVSSGVCEHDKNKALDKIRAEILRISTYKKRAEILRISSYEGFELGGVKEGYRIAMVNVLNIIDKYKAETENP